MEGLLKKVAIIGIGNAGGQVAYLAEKRYSSLFDVVYINSSESDLSMVGGSGLKFKIGDDDVEGSGKNRNRMKEYLRGSIGDIIRNKDFEELIADKLYVFIVSSAAGGTGSGAAPVLLSILREIFVDVNFILVGILPSQKSSLMEIGNAREYCDELYRNLAENTTYMIYDNDTVSDLPVTRALETVNEAIVEDIKVLTGVDNFPTPYESIDEADMETILTTPGRLLVTRVTGGITEKVMEGTTIDEMLIKSIKTSKHAETNRDKRVVRCGIVTYFTDAVNRLYRPDLNELFEFTGTPVERFNHNAVNSNSEDMNFTYLILSGLSPINDRIHRMDERAEELQKALANSKVSGYTFANETSVYDVMKDKKRDRQRGNDNGVDINSIFDKF